MVAWLTPESPACHKLLVSGELWCLLWELNFPLTLSHGFMPSPVLFYPCINTVTGEPRAMSTIPATSLPRDCAQDRALPWFWYPFSSLYSIPQCIRSMGGSRSPVSHNRMLLQTRARDVEQRCTSQLWAGSHPSRCWWYWILMELLCVLSSWGFRPCFRVPNLLSFSHYVSI